ncbi:hypothetical protein ABS767_01765 [Sphingomonas sp. ST-64]|uniref:Uncharacterized protein n=1 Tax=Sphingomonas plantiphila TaxID=3163295 RepID=A0ABW8YJP0_9SPHN
MSGQFVIPAAALAVAIAITAALMLSRFGRSDQWIATVTPLASIIGSGFLVCGPLLAREFGLYAAPAMAVLLLLAYAIGAVIRFNIAHAEPHLAQAGRTDTAHWMARVGQVVLAIAYAVSVAYYLKLLAMFALKAAGSQSELIGNIIVTAILGVLALLALRGGLRRVEHVAHASVSIKLGLIGGMLAALGIGWAWHGGTAGSFPVPVPGLDGQSLLLLLGLLITVQGFETSRYMGEEYDAPTRIRTMRHAQLIAAGIYIAFLVLLTPWLGDAAHSRGVAGVLDVMTGIAAPLGSLVLAAAVASQLSAAVADAIGSTGIAIELSGKRLGVAAGFLIAAGLSISVTWFTNSVMVIALASRAFAAYYAIQCGIGIAVARADGKAGLLRQCGFAALAAICVAAALFGAPAEGEG